MESDIGFKSFESIGFRDLKKGDQIAVKGVLQSLDPMLRWKFLEHIVGDKYYSHHGIYIGDFTVVDFGGKDKYSAKARKVDLQEFMFGACDKKLYRLNYCEGVCLPAEETVRRAVLAHGTQTWPIYDVISNNCETFATYMKTGMKASQQAARALANMVKYSLDVPLGHLVASGRSLGSGSSGSSGSSRGSRGSGTSDGSAQQ